MRPFSWIVLGGVVVTAYVGGRVLLTRPADLPDRTLSLQYPPVVARNWHWLTATALLRDNSGAAHGAVLSLCQMSRARDGERSIRIGHSQAYYFSSVYIRFSPPFRVSSGLRQVYEVVRNSHRRILLTASPTHFPWHNPGIATLVAPRCADASATIVVVNMRTGRVALHGTLPAYKAIPEFRTNGLLNMPPWPSELPPDPNL